MLRILERLEIAIFQSPAGMQDQLGMVLQHLTEIEVTQQKIINLLSTPSIPTGFKITVSNNTESN
jgi:hypothetical protein